MKKIKEELQKSEERYRALFDHMRDCVAIYRAENDGEDFVFLDFNKSAEMTEHIQKKDLIGKSVLEIFPSVKDFGIFDVFQRVWKTGKPESHHVAHYEDERISGWRDNFVYKLPSGEIVAVYSDETERIQVEESLRESDERFRRLYEQAPLGYQSLDADGCFITINQTWLNLMGYSREQVIGRRFVDFLAPHEADTFKNRFSYFIATGEIHIDVQMVQHTGSTIIVHIDGRIGYDERGRFKQTHCILNNITERKQAEEEFLKAQKLESVGVLAGGIAHDFNNILTTIIGNISLAKDQVAPEDEIFDLLNEAVMASTRARTLTKQLLTFAKGGAPVKETASIEDVLKESTSFVLRGSKSKCKFSIADDLWPVEMDPWQISQVINNVVINANLAMPKGGIILVAAKNLIIEDRHGLPVKPGRYIRISIVSSGYSDDPVLANFQEYGFKGMMPKQFEFGSLVKVLHEVLQGGEE